MKDRGKKEVESYTNDNYYEETMCDIPCKKHPPSGGGICAYCLTDRLVQLVCPDCGEQRLLSCSCSEGSSSDPTPASVLSSGSAEVGSVGRISFLLENDKKGGDQNEHDMTSLRRSNSICVASNRIRRSEKGGGIWKIGKLLRRKIMREKKKQGQGQNGHFHHDESKSEMGLSECLGVSRSRSLCSFRGFYDTEESGGFAVSSSSAARNSSVSGTFMLDSAKRSCFSESEARISNFDYYDAGFVGPNKNIFSLKESEFISDDPGFIDLKLHESGSGLGSDLKPELPVLKRHDMFKTGGSCRISVSERELRKCKKSYKVWRWFFRHQTSSRRKDEDHDSKS